MTKVEVYNSDYTKLNHAYIEIYNTYEKLIQCDDADEEILAVLENILRPFNPALDRIKSEMTVKTRYKDEPAENKSSSQAHNVTGEKTSGGGVILHGNFTGE